MIGVGTQDSLGMAEDFVEAYGTTSFTMLWDPSFDSWAELGITGQPAGMLVSSGGELLGQWRGAIPEEAVLEEVAKL
mgnify:FL=1